MVERLDGVLRGVAAQGSLWIAWPKKASGVPSDLTQVVVRDTGLDKGLVDYKVCSIDGTWSGLLFTRRGSGAGGRGGVALIIDSHTHVFPPELSRRREALLDRDLTLSTMYSDPRARMADAEELVATMDGAGIDVSVMVGIGWKRRGPGPRGQRLRHRLRAPLPVEAEGVRRRQPALGRRRRRRSGAVRRRRAGGHRRASPGYAGLRLGRQGGDGARGGGGRSRRHAHSHARIRAGGALLPRQGEHHAAGALPLHRDLSSRSRSSALTGAAACPSTRSCRRCGSC